MPYKTKGVRTLFINAGAVYFNSGGATNKEERTLESSCSFNIDKLAYMIGISEPEEVRRMTQECLVCQVVEALPAGLSVDSRIMRIICINSAAIIQLPFAMSSTTNGLSKMVLRGSLS